MPRVSEEHLAARRRQIIEAAARCFARNGFHRTSMQDVFRESGLSAGAVYRYFRSKDDLVGAIADQTVGSVSEHVERLVAHDPLPPLADIFRQLFQIVDRYTGPEGPLRLAIQVWGESITDPQMGVLVRDKYDILRSHFVVLARRAQESGQLPLEPSAEDLGRALFGVVPGYILQRVLLGDVDSAGYAAGITALLTRSAPPSTRQNEDAQEPWSDKIVF